LTETPPFIVVRHGRTQFGAEGRFQGHLPVGLDEAGLEQARNAGRRLSRLAAAGEISDSYQRIIASDLPRAVETARAIAEQLMIPETAVGTDPRLRELAFGRWEGMTTQEVKNREPDLRRARKRDRWNFTPPGGESYAFLAARVAKWLGYLDAPAIVVTHSGTMRVMAHLLAGWSTDRAMVEKIGYCEMWSWKNNELLRL
jgi:broad specificity phosphatase PhoE